MARTPTPRTLALALALTLALTLTLTLAGYAHVIAVPALLFEATAPFVNARYFLATAGLKVHQ